MARPIRAELRRCDSPERARLSPPKNGGPIRAIAAVNDLDRDGLDDFAVGIPASLLRFAALHCYDNVRHHRLPPELQDKNPTGRMWRLIDGEWTQQDA